MPANSIKPSHIYGFIPLEMEGVELLAQLALDMRWSWNHEADKLWEKIDPALWELTQNPWVVLQTVSHDQLERQLADPAFRQLMQEVQKSRQAYLQQKPWFQDKYPHAALTQVAYFSMEYMLSEALPIYVGGLGNVAGDQLKAASDLGVPVTAVGLLYQQGYFRQDIDANGNQQAYFPYNDPGSLPITPLRLPNGEWLRIKISLPGYPLWLRAWQVQVGRVQLYLLDSNDPANLPIHRGITSELYGGGQDLRIKQEMVLGIGGWRLLKALGVEPELCHLNEGHAAFVVLERAADCMKATGLSFETALSAVRAGTLFTTHTAVDAGFDYFPQALVEHYFSDYVRHELKIDMASFLALGRKDDSNSFNMAFLAIRGSAAVNGVSRLHGRVSRHLFSSLFPRWPIAEVPVGFVTNGVHMPSWDSGFADELWTNACGKHRWKGDLETAEAAIQCITDETLWVFRNQQREALVNYVRQRFERQATLSGQSAEMIERAKELLDYKRLTLGFARRFVPYKRPNLLLQDPARLVRLLTDEQYPVQLVLAGKAPPYDEAGKALIRQWNEFIRHYNLYDHVLFLSDYDMHLAEHLVQGVDVWVNTPRRPWEACGTSGMKVLVNGGLNLSELDGWWAEAYAPDIGWAIGDAREHGDDPSWDAKEAEDLYTLLEKEIIPAFYQRNEQAIPEQWVARMRHSMARLTPRFSANRTVREYTEQYYLPMAKAYRGRLANNAATARRIQQVAKLLQQHWASCKTGELSWTATDNGYMVQAGLQVHELIRSYIKAELFANGLAGEAPEVFPMDMAAGNGNEGNMELIATARVVTHRPSSDFTLRVLPCYEQVAVPLKDPHILWQH
ncbi:alpha-glucan family phosphorylase [Flavihumibacter sp. CACIAM 22H1]|uniref:alpha-glucan family phosphorylase n=1 Tax=Flavihumibacter sp. CACIAM 22H1 TaxID=1812911 RepID=UPI0007A837D8|nr:alpha-glucan family phosphorylase [Flavihumibacter sp. CACIAM 22H1]KYP14624.1 MAG: alpha-glucan phosphorylase [Flavihumibacter sp. CACIAM 22H1]